MSADVDLVAEGVGRASTMVIPFLVLGVQVFFTDHKKTMDNSVPLSERPEPFDKNFRRNHGRHGAPGFESTIVATDGGQVENPMWSEALAEYVVFLLQAAVQSLRTGLSGRRPSPRR